MNKNKTVLILIDIQNESNFGVENVESVVENASTLISACREQEIPIIYTRQINRADRKGLSRDEELNPDGTPVYYCSGTDAVEIISDIAPASGDIVLDKYRWSAFYQTSLDLFLDGMGVEDIIIGGLVSDGCLMTSAIDGYYRNYQIHLIKDMCATTCDGGHIGSILMMANWLYGIQIYNAAEIIKRLKGQTYRVWQSDRAAPFHFTPENMRELYARLDDEATLQGEQTNENN